MVRYYGRAKQRTGAVNTNQLGLKMSGCPSRVGRRGILGGYINQRVSCARGICATPLVHMVAWHKTYKNRPPFCVTPANKCLAAAGGIGNINTPYYKTIQPGKPGCGLTPYEVLEIEGGVGGLDKCAKWKTAQEMDDQEVIWYGSTAPVNCAGGFFGNSGSLVPAQQQGPQDLLFGTPLLNNPIAVTNVQFGAPEGLFIPKSGGGTEINPTAGIKYHLWFDTPLLSPDIRVAKATYILTTSSGTYTFNLVTDFNPPFLGGPGTCFSGGPICAAPPNNLIEGKIPLSSNPQATALFNALIAGYNAGEIMDLCVKDVVLVVA